MWFRGNSRYGSAQWFRTTPAKRANRSTRQVGGTSTVATAWPAHGRPSRRETSCSVGAISPTGRWNVCVSGLHRSSSAERSDMSKENFFAASSRGTSASRPSPSTNLASGRRPEARNLQHKYSKLYFVSNNVVVISSNRKQT